MKNVLLKQFLILKIINCKHFLKLKISDSANFIRREILPSGKSRAFVNDSPVNLNSLQLLGERLIDIHSARNTSLTSNEFQFQIIDALANNEETLQTYKLELKAYKKLKKELQELIDFQTGCR